MKYFSNRYDSVTKQSEISSQLMALKMSDVKDDEDEGYAALDKLIA